MAQSGRHDYKQLEETLGKTKQGDLEFGITLASDAINKYANDSKLYLLRAKLSFKLLRMQNRQKVDEHFKNCLADCEQAIAIIESGDFTWGDITTVKIQALQLGYLCCEQLNNAQKEREFGRRITEMKLELPITEQTVNELLLIKPHQQSGEIHTYSLKEMLFPEVSFIEKQLLEDVIRCYKQRQTVCRNCFCNDLKLWRGFDANGVCTQCHWEYKKLLVIPKSPMTVNHYKFDMIAIPPWPKSKPNDLPFESCAKPTDKTQDHRRCLIMSRNSAVWYAHTVEELVIWTVEREYGCSFEDFIRKSYEPLHPVAMALTSPPYQPPAVMFTPAIMSPFQSATAMYCVSTVNTTHAELAWPDPHLSYSFSPRDSLPTTTSYSDRHTNPTVSFTQPSVPVGALTQSQCEEMVQQFENISLSSLPSSPDGNPQLAVTNTQTVTKNTVNE